MQTPTTGRADRYEPPAGEPAELETHVEAEHEQPEIGAEALHERYERHDRHERRERPQRHERHEPDAEDLRERDLVAFLARGLVDHPDDVSVEILSTGPEATYELHVHQDDLGHVIGKQGRTARSLRLALGAAAARTGRRAFLEIAD